VDADKEAPGMQELKEWVGLMEYVRRFPDLNDNGIPDIPAKYAGPLGRIVPEPSYGPGAMLSSPGLTTWIALGAVVLVLGLLAGLVVLVVWLVRRPARRKAG
jgi:hypothetical protein